MKFIFSNRPLRILLGTNTLILLAPALIAPIYAIYVKEIGGNLLDASFTASVFAIAAGLTTIIAGKYSDKLNKHHSVIIIGSLIMSLGFLLYIFVNSVMALFLVQIVIGFGEAIYYPPFTALYSHHLDKKQAATQWAAWGAIDYFTTALGATLGGLIVTYFGFTPLFIIMALLNLTSGIYIYLLPHKTL